jgi:hypothetical protein
MCKFSTNFASHLHVNHSGNMYSNLEEIIFKKHSSHTNFTFHFGPRINDHHREGKKEAIQSRIGKQLTQRWAVLMGGHRRMEKAVSTWHHPSKVTMDNNVA